MRPTARLMMSHPAHFISLGFGSGLSPWAPGTMGTLLAWALYPLIRTPLSEFVFLALLASLFVAGVLAADRTGRALGVPDHGGIVWDEMYEICSAWIPRRSFITDNFSELININLTPYNFMLNN